MNPAKSNQMTLAEVIQRVSQHNSVLGILQIGSLSQGQVTADSDYDIVIILDQAVRAWYVGVTRIDGRFTDLIFVDHKEIERVLQLDAPVPNVHPLTPILRWLHTGKVIFSHSTSLDKAKEKIMAETWIESVSSDEAYQAWFQINYNLAQTRRMLGSDLPIYRQVGTIRMAVYGYMDLWFGYFSLRKLAWDGDKAAVTYLRQHDPQFLSAYQAFIQSTADPRVKFDAYEKAASLAAAPFGGLWAWDITVMNVESSQGLWHRLLGD